METTTRYQICSIRDADGDALNFADVIAVTDDGDKAKVLAKQHSGDCQYGVGIVDMVTGDIDFGFGFGETGPDDEEEQTGSNEE